MIDYKTSLAHSKKESEIFKALKTSEKGLSNHEAEQRLHHCGFNELKIERLIVPWKIFLQQFTSPLVWILLIALIISLFLNEKIDALVIGIIIVFNALFGFFQEFRAEKAIEALKKLTSLQAKVIRDGRETKIDSKYLVPGDIIVLDSGDKVPADARLFEVHSLETQEAPLTGESQPVLKNSGLLKAQTLLADRINMVFSSTVVSKGKGKAVVTATGMGSEVGKIAKLIKEAQQKYTPLQKKLRILGKNLTIAIVIVAVIVFLAGILFGNSPTVMFLTAIALAVAAIPEGLPAVITISLALGVQRMIKKNSLVRQLPSIETLGSVDVICTDKTGTLTHNQMTVKKIFANNQVYDVTGSGYEDEGNFLVNSKKVNSKNLQTLLKIGLYCNDARLISEKGKQQVIGDPTEAALIVSANKSGLKNVGIKRIEEIPFTSERKMMTTFHNIEGKKVSYTKGAPDVIIEKCDRFLINGEVKRLDRDTKKRFLQQNEAFAEDALRVLGFAYNDKKEAEQNMVFVGLQAMIDPPRKEVKNSIKVCQEAGIRVMMITGDHLSTAKAIADQLGIKGKAISGDELEKLDLDKEIGKINIFARVNPEHKLLIVNALKKGKHIVAMTGDGVNDAPALKRADIGISMGITGTDVAKEASDMILTDDNFTTIVNAVEEGRGIFDNIRKFVNYLLSSNLGEVLVIFLATILGMGLPLAPLHILWVNLVTDGLPALALGLDPAQKDIMKRKPRKSGENIISKEQATNIFTLGLAIGIFTLILFWLYRGSPLIKAQTVAFTSLVVFEIVRLQMIRSDYNLSLFSNKYLIGAVISSLLLQVVVVYTPLNKIFKVVPLGLIDWVWILAAAFILIVIVKIIKKIKNKKNLAEG